MISKILSLPLSFSPGSKKYLSLILDFFSKIHSDSEGKDTIRNIISDSITKKLLKSLKQMTIRKLNQIDLHFLQSNPDRFAISVMDSVPERNAKI